MATCASTLVSPSTSSPPPALASTSGRDGLDNCSDDNNVSSFLARAQALEAPSASLTYGGEFEDLEWWEEHEELLRAAREQWGSKHASLHSASCDDAFEEAFIDPRIRSAVRGAYAAETDAQRRAAEATVRALLSPTEAENVVRFQLFQPRFCETLLSELRHWESSRIPMRRPNGMNRNGLVVDELGMDSMLQALVAKYVRPLAQLVFPRHATDGDFVEHHGFVVKYRRRAGVSDGGEEETEQQQRQQRQQEDDVKLAEHADAATVTLNVLLSDAGFEGGGLEFGGLRFSATEEQAERAAVAFEGHPAGTALLHLGQQLHGARELTAGERNNLVVWCFGRYGYVRVAPFEEHEQSDSASRWKLPGVAGLPRNEGLLAGR